MFGEEAGELHDVLELALAGLKLLAEYVEECVGLFQEEREGLIRHKIGKE